jgi:hypothetical protein
MASRKVHLAISLGEYCNRSASLRGPELERVQARRSDLPLIGPKNRAFRTDSRNREKAYDWLAEDAVARELFSAKFPANREK